MDIHNGALTNYVGLPQSELDARLINAVENGNQAEISALVAANANPNAMTPNNYETALMIAIFKGHTTIANQLIDLGANLNAVNINGDTALMYAVLRYDIVIINILLQRGADVNTSSIRGHTALMVNFGDDQIKIVAIADALLQYGADINATDKNGETLLMWQAFYDDNPNIISAYLQRGADINIISNKGETALMRAVKKGRTNTAYRLLCEMKAEQLDTFASISDDNKKLVINFKEALKQNSAKLRNVFMPLCAAYFHDSDNILKKVPSELLFLICEYEAAQSIGDIPEWYHHHAGMDARATLQLCLNAKQEPVIFTNNKRKAEDTPESAPERKRLKTTDNNDQEDNQDGMEVEAEVPTRCCIQ